jgi:hypothetical protein
VVFYERLAVSIHTRHFWRVNLKAQRDELLTALFQSTPAISGGWIVAWAWLTWWLTCFNPHPPFLAGESDDGFHIGFHKLVSIHTRHFWRVNLAKDGVHTIPYEFQSTPAISGGWIWNCWSARSVVARFNPHPPFLAGESKDGACGSGVTFEFQSTPAISGGWIILIRDRQTVRSQGFNPHPPFLAGESIPGPTYVTASLVSIHTRHFWRVNPCWAVSLMLRPQGFNPHPPFLAGESVATNTLVLVTSVFQSTPAISGGWIRGSATGHLQPREVSIHTRHFWRVNPHHQQLAAAPVVVSIHTRHFWRVNPALPAAGQAGVVVSIHTRHFWRVNSGCGATHHTGLMRFNPHPPFLAGELRSILCHKALSFWFQSTPAISGGWIYRNCEGRSRLWNVSIHTRHFWRVNSEDHMRNMGSVNSFNPHPPFLAGELTIVRKYKMADKFQSTPAISGGWIGRRFLRQHPMESCFNPHPPFLAGEFALLFALKQRPSLFQSTPAISGGWIEGRLRRSLCRNVSIHTRHFWRVNSIWSIFTASPTQFQSTPAISGGWINNPARLWSWVKLFQSTPAISGGWIGIGPVCIDWWPVSIHTRHFWRVNYSGPLRWWPQQRRFNPHPPFLAGELALHRAFSIPDSVSIHTRHFWRVNSFPCKSFSRMQKTSCFRELVACVSAVFVPGGGERQRSLSNQQVAGCANPLGPWAVTWGSRLHGNGCVRSQYQRAFKVGGSEVPVLFHFRTSGFGHAVQAKAVLVQVDFGQQAAFKPFVFGQRHLAFKHRFLHALACAFTYFCHPA